MTVKKCGWLIVAVLLVHVSCSKQDRRDDISPKLIVFISIDQFRYDYLSRFSSYFGADGFNYLLKNGATMTNAHYEHAATHTSVGHSVMSSGAYPYRNGIIANNWWDRNTGRKVYAVEDTASPILGSPADSKYDGRSPRNLLGSTIGDQLKIHTNGKAKVFAIANKDRSGILMAGRMADAAYWMDDKEGRIVTSTFYMKNYPQWMNDYNDKKPLDKWLDKKWELLLPEKEYPVISDDIKKHYDDRFGIGANFPHGVGEEDHKNYYEALRRVPFGDEALIDLAKELVVKEHLGEDGITDLLCMSFSPNDYVGHMFGPNSREMMDVTIRTDRYLADWFKYLDQKVGLNHILFVLTADHGVPPLPEESANLHFNASRVITDSVKTEVEKVMKLKFGALAVEKKYVAELIDLNFYFNPKALVEKKVDKKEAEEYISTFLEKNTKGVFRAYTYTQLRNGTFPKDAISNHVVKDFFADRTGDVVIILDPFCVFAYNDHGTDHGMPYSYDTHVPVVIAGRAWIKHGAFNDACSPADIAPTLATILNIEFPTGSDGRVLGEILRK